MWGDIITNYNAYLGTKKGMQFPVMCDGYILIEYSEKIHNLRRFYAGCYADYGEKPNRCRPSLGATINWRPVCRRRAAGHSRP